MGLVLKHSVQKLPRLSHIDVAVVAFAVWTVVNDAFIQQRECNCYCSLVVALLCYAGIRMVRHKSELILGLIAVWSMVEAVVSMMQFCGFVESNHLLFSATGTFRNPGPLGGFLAVGVTVFAGLAVRSKESKAISMIFAAALCLVAVMLAMADSRAGWLAVIAGTVFVFWPQIFRLWQRCRVYVKASIVIIALCLFSVIYVHKAQSAAGRLLIWRVTSDMIADSPVTGHGSGSFAEKYMYYQAGYFKNHPNSSFANRAGVVDRSFNDLLRAWSEGGIVAVAIICFIAYNIDWKASGKQRIVNAAIISVAAFAMFSYPSYIIHFQLLCAALLACASCKSCVEKKERNATFIGSILLAACCGLVVYSQNRETCAAENVKRFIFTCGDAAVDDYETLSCTPSLLAMYATYATMYLPHVESKKLLEYTVTKTPTPDLLCDLALEYTKDKDYARAEETLQTAKYMMPRKIRPQYELYRLAVACGDTLQARSIISQCSMEVENTSALRMVGEMKRFYANTSMYHGAVD